MHNLATLHDNFKFLLEYIPLGSVIAVVCIYDILAMKQTCFKVFVLQYQMSVHSGRQHSIWATYSWDPLSIPLLGIICNIYDELKAWTVSKYTPLYRYWPGQSQNITFRWTAKRVIFSQWIIFSLMCVALRENIVPRENITILAPPTHVSVILDGQYEWFPQNCMCFTTTMKFGNKTRSLRTKQN